MAHDRQANHLHINSIEYISSEMDTIKHSMSGMMELIVGEIDSIKRELYLDFGQNQKIILEDVEQLKAREGILEDKWNNFELQMEKSER